MNALFPLPNFALVSDNDHPVCQFSGVTSSERTLPDPSFQEWGRNQWRIQDFPEEGAPTYGFAKYSPKMHEIERIWMPGGEGRALLP